MKMTQFRFFPILILGLLFSHTIVLSQEGFTGRFNKYLKEFRSCLKGRKKCTFSQKVAIASGLGASALALVYATVGDKLPSLTGTHSQKSRRKGSTPAVSLEEESGAGMPVDSVVRDRGGSGKAYIITFLGITYLRRNPPGYQTGEQNPDYIYYTASNNQPIPITIFPETDEEGSRDWHQGNIDGSVLYKIPRKDWIALALRIKKSTPL